MKIYLRGTAYTVQNQEEAHNLVSEYAEEHDMYIWETVNTSRGIQYILRPKEIPQEVIELYRDE